MVNKTKGSFGKTKLVRSPMEARKADQKITQSWTPGKTVAKIRKFERFNLTLNI